MKQLGITSLAPIRLKTCMVEATGTNSNETRHDQLDTLFRCLARSKRRRIVGFVFEHAPDPVPQDELATMLAAWTHGKSYEDVTGEERQRVAGKLRHVHLPSLAAAGLVEHDTEDHTVSLTEHPAFEDPTIREIIGDDPSDSPESLDAFFRAIAEGRRRTCLDILSHQFGSIHVETLARELAASGRDVRPSEVPAEDADSVVTTLSHVDLPHLSDAGLVEYDADDATVAYAGHPHLRVPWMHSVLRPEFRPSLTGESNPEGVGEIEGREQVVSFGQSLCDRADEELFCMFTDTDLLEAGCLTRIRDAARDRDVDVYLGTRDPTIREYVRENAPEVVLWEPNTDWLNLPAAGDRVGRLLLADREAVMLGTLLKERTDGFHEEQAIVGEGEHNTLVTMVCQLLGPHLEEIDGESEPEELSLPL